MTEPRIELVGSPVVQLPSARLPRPAVLAAPPGPFVPHRARELTQAACRAWRLPHLADAATLTADELVTNAVVHAQTFLELHVAAVDGDLVLAVHDRDPGFDPGWWDFGSSTDEPRGARYGLALVRRLSRGYGCYLHDDGGKVMWAALASAGGSAGDERSSSTSAAEGASVGPCSEQRPVRRTIVVNRARPGTGSQRDRWRLELVLGWLPEDPDHVDISLRPTPLHPALPAGNWRACRDTLRRGLERSAGDAAVRLHRDPAGRTVLLELAAEPPHLVQFPVHQLRAFIDAIDAATPDHGDDGDPAARTARCAAE